MFLKLLADGDRAANVRLDGGTPGGGGGGFCPRMRSMIHAPRSTGDVVVPLAVTLSTAACVMSPPRGLSAGNGIRRKATPGTDGRP